MIYVKYAVIVLGLLIIGVAAFGGYKFLENEKQEVQQAKTETEALQNTPLNQAKAELAKNNWTSGAIKTEYDEASRTLNITDETEPGGGLDQVVGEVSSATPEEVLQQTYNLYVRAGQAVFKVDGIDNLVVLRKIPVNRGTGIVTVTEVARIQTTKDMFLEVDWESLEGKVIHQAVDDSAEKLDLDTGFVRSIRNANVLILVPSF